MHILSAWGGAAELRLLLGPVASALSGSQWVLLAKQPGLLIYVRGDSAPMRRPVTLKHSQGIILHGCVG